MNDESSPQAQRMALDILKKLKLFSTNSNVVLQWLEKIEKDWCKYVFQ